MVVDHAIPSSHSPRLQGIALLCGHPPKVGIGLEQGASLQARKRRKIGRLLVIRAYSMKVSDFSSGLVPASFGFNSRSASYQARLLFERGQRAAAGLDGGSGGSRPGRMHGQGIATSVDLIRR
jgi:hypothetical protein